MATVFDRARFVEALQAPSASAALHQLALALKAEGMSQTAMYHLFAEYQARTDANDPRYDAIVDNMELIWGGPWAKGHALFDHDLTDEEIAKSGPQ